MGHKFKEAAGFVNERVDDPLTAGFVIGQVEKVFLGACDACMIPQCAAISWSFLCHLARIYDLHIKAYEVDDWQHEFWLTRQVGPLPFITRNPKTPEWNLIRGRMCGVPTKEINLEFHP